MVASPGERGGDVAIESAGVTLRNGDLSGIVRGRRLSRATMQNLRQNRFVGFICDASGAPIAVGALYPVGLLLSPTLAVRRWPFLPSGSSPILCGCEVRFS